MGIDGLGSFDVAFQMVYEREIESKTPLLGILSSGLLKLSQGFVQFALIGEDDSL